jgi:outer membrane protein assembly factor BamB
MQNLRNKSKISTIALILILTISAIFVALPIATAQEPTTKMAFPYIGAVPNPSWVGHETLLHVGITEPLQEGREYWAGLTVLVEKPDGTTATLGPVNTDATGGTGLVFVPDQVGTYYLRTHFPEQWYNYTGMSFFGPLSWERLYLEATSDPLALEVMAEPAPGYPDPPLPTEYWTRPIDAQLRSWSAISGSWLTAPPNLYAPYNDGPETAHILWAKPLTYGGIAGGEYGGVLGHSFEIGDAYEGKWTGSTGSLSWLSSAIIVAGKLYYQHSTLDLPVVYHCVDLRTGEELWAKTFMNNQTIDFGQILYWDSFNMHGAFAYLVVTTGGSSFFGPPAPENWYFFDPITGDWLFTYENVPSGTNIIGPNGEIYRYTVNMMAGTVSLWNSSQTVLFGEVPPNSGSWGARAHGHVFNASRGIEWTKPLPAGLTGSAYTTFLEDRLIGGAVSTTNVNLWGVSLEPGKEGTLLFNNNWAPPAYWDEGNVTVSGFGGGFVAWSKEDKVGVIFVKETREHYGFSLETGEYIWGPTEPQYYLDALDDTHAEARAIAYGNLYSASVGGIVYCYDIQTGERLWEFDVNDPYQEILWANNWWQKPLFITDGMIYCGTLEHSPIDPRPRGGPMVCLNATTGELIWRADGLFRQTRWGGRAIIGDSVIATMDTYDQRVYAIGKGPSSTTVTAGPKVIEWGSSVMIEGMVTDESPGTKDAALTMRFPNGVPAVSDESMSEWMLYTYKQFPCPQNVEGVEVVLETLDPNNNFYEIGRATSDASGFYSILWEPPVPGRYTIYATFEGTGSYFGSYAETAMGVTEAPTPAAAIEPEPAAPAPAPTQPEAAAPEPTQPTQTEPEPTTPETTTPEPTTPAPTEATETFALGTTELAIIAVVIIAVVGVVAFWALKKRK